MSRRDAAGANKGPLMKALIVAASGGATAGAGAVVATQPRPPEAAVPSHYLGGGGAFVNTNGRSYYEHGGHLPKALHESDYTDSDADTFVANPYARPSTARGASAIFVTAPKSLGVAAPTFSASAPSIEAMHPAAQMPEAAPLKRRGRSAEASTAASSEESLGEGAPPIAAHVRTRYSRARSLTQASLAPRAASAGRRKSLTVRFSAETLESALQAEAAAAAAAATAEEAAVEAELLLAEVASEQEAAVPAAEAPVASEEERGDEGLVAEDAVAEENAVEAPAAEEAPAAVVEVPAVMEAPVGVPSVAQIPVAEVAPAERPAEASASASSAKTRAAGIAKFRPSSSHGSFKIVKVPGTGACLFTAAQKGLEELHRHREPNPFLDLTAADFRGQIIEEIRSDRDTYDPIFSNQIIDLIKMPDYEFETLTEPLKSALARFRQLKAQVLPPAGLEDEIDVYAQGQGRSDYLTALAVPTAWGGYLELSAISRLFNVQIVVHYREWRIDRVPFCFGHEHAQCIYLLFDGSHYDLLLSNPLSTTPDAEIFSFRSSAERDLSRAESPARGGAGRPEDHRSSEDSPGSPDAKDRAFSDDKSKAKAKADTEIPDFNEAEQVLLERLMAQAYASVTGPHKDIEMLKTLFPDQEIMERLHLDVAVKGLPFETQERLLNNQINFLQLREEQLEGYLRAPSEKKAGKMLTLDELKYQLGMAKEASIEATMQAFLEKNHAQVWRWTAEGNLIPFNSADENKLNRAAKDQVEAFRQRVEAELSKITVPDCYHLREYVPLSDLEELLRPGAQATAKAQYASGKVVPVLKAEAKRLEYERDLELHAEAARNAHREALAKVEELKGKYAYLAGVGGRLAFSGSDRDASAEDKKHKQDSLADQDNLLIQEALAHVYERQIELSPKLKNDIASLITRYNAQDDKVPDAELFGDSFTIAELRVRVTQAISDKAISDFRRFCVDSLRLPVLTGGIYIFKSSEEEGVVDAIVNEFAIRFKQLLQPMVDEWNAWEVRELNHSGFRQSKAILAEEQRLLKLTVGTKLAQIKLQIKDLKQILDGFRSRFLADKERLNEKLSDESEGPRKRFETMMGDGYLYATDAEAKKLGKDGYTKKTYNELLQLKFPKIRPDRAYQLIMYGIPPGATYQAQNKSNLLYLALNNRHADFDPALLEIVRYLLRNKVSISQLNDLVKSASMLAQEHVEKQTKDAQGEIAQKIFDLFTEVWAVDTNPEYQRELNDLARLVRTRGAEGAARYAATLEGRRKGLFWFIPWTKASRQSELKEFKETVSDANQNVFLLYETLQKLRDLLKKSDRGLGRGSVLYNVLEALIAEVSTNDLIRNRETRLIAHRRDHSELLAAEKVRALLEEQIREKDRVNQELLARLRESTAESAAAKKAAEESDKKAEAARAESAAARAESAAAKAESAGAKAESAGAKAESAAAGKRAEVSEQKADAAIKAVERAKRKTKEKSEWQKKMMLGFFAKRMSADELRELKEGLGGDSSDSDSETKVPDRVPSPP